MSDWGMGEWGAPIAFHQPLWLLLVPLLAALWRGIHHARGARLAAFAEPRLLAWLLRGAPPGRPSRITLLGWTLLAVALSGPYLPDAPEVRAERGIDVAVVVDISPSMAATDVTPDRLGRARLELHDLLERHGGRVALIAYSAHAYRVLPLTHDAGLAHGFIEALDTNLTRHSGSNLVQALELAARSLAAAGDRGRAVLIVGDGEVPDRADTITAADRLAAQGIPVFALGIGTTAGAAVPSPRGHARGPDGLPVISRLDRDLLATLAARTGGRYVDAVADERDTERLLAGFTALERDPLRGSAPGHALHPWLLAAGLALLLWRGFAPARAAATTLPALLAVCVTLTAAPAAPQAQAQAGESPLSSSPWTARAAWKALDGGRHDEAAALYARLAGFDARLGEGAAAWRRGDWPGARAHYVEAERLARDDDERATALYNQANALARMQRLREAVETFDRALALRPDHARAAHNRDLVTRALERRRAPAPPRAGDPAADGMRDATTVAGGEAQDPDGGGGDGDGEATPGARAGASGPEDTAPAGAVAGAPVVADTLSGLAASRAAAIEDDPREVLRHRFTVLDAPRTRLPEAHAW